MACNNPGTTAGDQARPGSPPQARAAPAATPSPLQAGQGAGASPAEGSVPGRQRARAPDRPPLPHSPTAGHAPHPPGPQQRLGASGPRPRLWKEAGAAAAPSPPPPLGFTWPGSPRCPDLPPPALRFPPLPAIRVKGHRAEPSPLTLHRARRQPLHLSNSLRVWRWRPPS